MSKLPELRYVDGGELRPLLDPARNTDVLAFLEAHSPSAHSDLSGEMMDVARATCGDFVAYSPSFGQCKYVVLITARTVFALAESMREVYYRLAPEARALALRSGGTPVDRVGPEWVAFEVFSASRPKPDLAYWTLAAYTAAREGATA